MKKTTKKTPSKASHGKAVKDLEVKTGKGRTVRGASQFPNKPTQALANLFLKTQAVKNLEIKPAKGGTVRGGQLEYMKIK